MGMQALRGQWKASILIVFSDAENDIPALQARLDMADRRVFVRALRKLEKDRLLARTAGGTVYSLTPDGHRIIGPLRDIAQWQTMRSKKGA